MDLSGIIFVALAVAWAGYLIPKALKHHDEVARTRSIDRFSTAMRVLAHREPVSRRDARLVVSPARSADNPRMLVPAASDGRAARSEPVRRAAGTGARAAARAAARRRRRILTFLLLAGAAVGALAATHVVPLWAPAAPVALVIGYLVLCRTQVRHQAYAAWERELDAPAYDDDAEVAPRRAVRVEALDGTPHVTLRNEQGFEEVDPLDDTVSMPAVVDAVAVPTADGGSLWDPLPVTLPTYVTKPKTKRTVRTIDLNDADTWSSGRSEEDSRLVAESEAAATEETRAEAVGS
ncbi:MAG TPA: hypothetical protein VFJ19_06580 [Nocardioidaceae bacterium]|nr:hypothetical protein [Nocardioidaceae bacterium]